MTHLPPGSQINLSRRQTDIQGETQDTKQQSVLCVAWKPSQHCQWMSFLKSIVSVPGGSILPHYINPHVKYCLPMSTTTTPCLCVSDTKSLSPDTSIEKGHGSGGGVRLSCYHVGTLFGTVAFLEYSTFCFSHWRQSLLRCWTSMCNIYHKGVRNFNLWLQNRPAAYRLKWGVSPTPFFFTPRISGVPSM